MADELTLDDVVLCPNLPSLPAAAVQVLELAQDSDVRLKAMAEVIQNDPALTARILKTVNSSYYGLQKPCPTILRALTYLGLNLVKSLVLGFSLVDVTRRAADGFDFQDFWRRSLCSAATARRLAMLHRRCDPEEAFIAALMQDIGMLALVMAARQQYDEIVAAASADHRRLAAMERDKLGFDHAEVGAAFGRRWRLPEMLVEAIREHHDPQDGDYAEIVRTVHVSAEAVLAMSLSDPASALGRSRQLAHEWYELGTDAFDEVLQAVPEDAQQLARLFSVKIGGTPDVARLLGKADEVRSELAVQTNRKVRELEDQLDSAHDDTVGPAPGTVGAKQDYERMLEHRFTQARSFHGQLGLLVVDADGFADVIRDVGEDAAESALREVGRRLQAGVRSVDGVCRLDEDVFGVILPGASFGDVSRVGERLRQSIEETPIEVEVGEDGKTRVRTLRLSVSLGGAVFEARSEGLFTSPSLLHTAAQRAVKAAKDAGRNATRIFRPRAAA